MTPVRPEFRSCLCPCLWTVDFSGLVASSVKWNKPRGPSQGGGEDTEADTQAWASVLPRGVGGPCACAGSVLKRQDDSWFLFRFPH